MTANRADDIIRMVIIMKRLLSVCLSLVMIITVISSAPFGAIAQANKNGIDISEHNGDFDLDAAVSQGSGFVMIRLGYFNHLDKCFLDNVKKAAGAGVDFGVYLYSYAFDSDEALT